MRFWVRSLLIVAGSVVALLLLPRALGALGVPPGVAFGLTAVALAAGANGLLYLALRCPRCGKWACRLPSGHGTVVPGLRCRYCGQEY
jgi:hypothetical protein